MSAGERSRRIFELFKTIPDEDRLRATENRRMIFEREPPHGSTLPPGKRTGRLADVEASRPPAPFFRRFEKGAEMTADLQDFRARAEQRLITIELLLKCLPKGGIEILHQLRVIEVARVIGMHVFLTLQDSANLAEHQSSDAAVHEGREIHCLEAFRRTAQMRLNKRRADVGFAFEIAGRTKHA